MAETIPVVRPICIMPGTLNLGGIGRNTLNLAEELVSRGVPVDLFLTRAEGHYLGQVPPSVQIFEGGGSARRSFAALTRYLRLRNPVALITAHAHIDILGILTAKVVGGDTKVICTVRTHTSIDRRSKGFYHNLIIALTKAVYRYADHLAAVSAGVADDLARSTRIPRHRIQVVYNPALNRRVVDQASEPIHHPWFDDPGRPVIIAVGRLTRQKAFDVLLQAFSLIRRTVDARLLILGEGEERSSLESLANDLGLTDVVSMPGFVPNPVAYVARASVFVLSSGWEGFGNALVEAMAVGTPVVSTDCPSGPAEILDHGRYGRMAPVGDAQLLAAAIVNTLRDPLPRPLLIERAREFSASTAADRFLELAGGVRAGPF